MLRHALWPIVVATVATSAAAADLQVAKSVAPVVDNILVLGSRFLPGGDVDVSLTVTNPAANALLPVRRVVIEDVIATTVKLKVTDYTTGGGPVEFTDGGVIGLLGSGLGYRFGGLGDATDSVEFYDGTTWTYTPTADAGGCDARVRKVRVTLTGTQATGGAFRLRYRTHLD